ALIGDRSGIEQEVPHRHAPSRSLTVFNDHRVIRPHSGATSLNRNRVTGLRASATGFVRYWVRLRRAKRSWPGDSADTAGMVRQSRGGLVHNAISIAAIASGIARPDYTGRSPFTVTRVPA